MQDANNKDSCKCEKCVGACKYRVGRFLPDEAEKVAEYLGISLKDLFKNYLMVDFYVKDGGDVYMLAPAIKGKKTGEMAPFSPTGECVFFENGECKIHPVKPFECKEYWHETISEEIEVTKKTIVGLWRGKNEYITGLLGKEPYLPDIDFGFFMELLKK